MISIQSIDRYLTRPNLSGADLCGARCHLLSNDAVYADRYCTSSTLLAMLLSRCFPDLMGAITLGRPNMAGLHGRRDRHFWKAKL